MKKLISILLAAVLLVPTLSGCGTKRTVNVAIVKDTVGVSFAQMVEQSQINKKDRKYKGTNFKFTVVDSYDEAEQLLKDKKADIITTTTPSAAKLYNNNKGKYVMSAVVSYAPLYILESSVEGTVSGMKDLKKTTIYAKQKGSFTDTILQQVLLGNRLDPKLNITVEYFDTNSAVNEAFYSNDGKLCYVSEPAATAIESKSEHTRVVIDVNDEWDKIYENTPICYIGIVSSQKFAKKHSEKIQELLEGYKESYSFMQDTTNFKQFGEYCKKHGITGGLSTASSLADNAKPVVLTGSLMQAKTSAFFDLMYKDNKNIFGQVLPNEEFYFDITK